MFYFELAYNNQILLANERPGPVANEICGRPKSGLFSSGFGMAQCIAHKQQIAWKDNFCYA